MKCSKSSVESKSLCVEALKNGKVVIIPTDTVYGFSGIVSPLFKCDKLIRKIKGREESKPFIQLISTPEDIFNYTDDDIPEYLLDYWPGPLTIIANDKRLNGQNNSTTAFRCPGDKWLREIIKDCGLPIYSTSVNRSGEPVLDCEDDILHEFSNDVDLIIVDGDKKNALPSTIVKIEDKKVIVLRQGAIKIE